MNHPIRSRAELGGLSPVSSVMRGAPARAIQELPGYQDLGTSRRYMHLSPAALDAAIRFLETGTDTSRVAVEKQCRRRESNPNPRTAHLATPPSNLRGPEPASPRTREPATISSHTP
jgi:hypothetical protein